MFKRKHRQCAKNITAKYKMQRFFIIFSKCLHDDKIDWERLI